MSLSQQEKKEVSNQLLEVAVLVEIANTGEKKLYPSTELLIKCPLELAVIANGLKSIREKGFGKDVKPHTFTK